MGPLELDESLAPAPYSTSFTGTTVSGVATMDVVNGKLRIVQDPEVTINVEGLNVQMENLFGGEADGLAKVVLRSGFDFYSQQSLKIDVTVSLQLETIPPTDATTNQTDRQTSNQKTKNRQSDRSTKYKKNK